MTLSSYDALSQQRGKAKTDPDWPCQQILVETISLPAVWSGPSIEDKKQPTDAAFEDLVARLSARRLPLDQAEAAIDLFARSKGANRESELTALFAALFERLNAERAQVIDGLRRFGRGQRELAAKIRAENALIQSGAASPENEGKDQKADALALDLRLFEEGHQTLTYVCETPTLIEQRMFALAKAIEARLKQAQP
ncbi:hypothetical protein [Methylocapsa acidiphila]|uniref:hypothetical protein n=1 Tax=Methylocapsa acidiphila TaxID=133552 RepID=UPI000428C540|nr:hypothetical protein [Methylocapsa acidiphila]